MSATLVVTQVAATINDSDWLPEGHDVDEITRAWAEHVNQASEEFKADHPEWFVC